MELKIDGQICDLKAGSIAVPGYDAARSPIRRLAAKGGR